jgi:PII-like signaling protein
VLGIAGATVFRGREGFGNSGELRRDPVVVVVIDRPEKVEQLRDAVDAMVERGMVATEPVEMLRVQKSATAK